MSDAQTTPVPLPPAPVLSYETGMPQTYFWLGRSICGLAMMIGIVSVGYIAASHVPGASPPEHVWTDVPVAVCGTVLAVFGALGIFRVSGSRMGILISAGLLTLADCAAQWVAWRLGWPADHMMMAYALVGVVDNATVPAFLFICLLREPIRGHFSVDQKRR
jgi:hypothetical protein